MEEISPSCLICRSAFDQKLFSSGSDDDYLDLESGDHRGSKCELVDRLILEQVENKRKITEQVVAALRIFAKLLGKEGSGGIGEVLDWPVTPVGSLSLGSPCCDECSGALISILKLQEIIDQNKAIQLERVAALKSSLIQSVPSGDAFETGWDYDDNLSNKCWARIRNLLVKCSISRQAFQVKRKRGRPLGKKSKPEEKVAESNCGDNNGITPCSEVWCEPETEASLQRVKLEHIEDSLQEEYREQVLEQTPGIDTDSSPRRSRRNFKRRLPAYNVASEPEFSDGDTDNHDLESKRLKRGTRRGKRATHRDSSISSNNQTDEDYAKNDHASISNNNGDYNEDVFDTDCKDNKNKTKEAVQKNLAKQERIRNRKKQVPQGKHILFLSPTDFLLYKYTPIQYTHSELKCREFGCSVTIEGTDYDAFQTLKAHIVACHSRWSSTPRRCPICSVLVPSGGLTIRRHFLKHHQTIRIPQAVCESCWKPISKNKVLAHAWRHKSKEEQAEALARGESDPTKYNIIAKSNSVIIKKISTSHGLQPETLRRRKSKKKVIKGKPIYGQPFQYVYFLSADNFLLFKYTPIQYSPTEFICRDFDCSVRIQGTDFDAFQKIKAHIEDCHSEEKYFETMRPCPLCNTPIDCTGLKFRHHITKFHRQRQTNKALVVCEACWKPSIVIGMRAHIWSHKNSEERAACLAKGERYPKSLLPVCNSKYHKYVCKLCGQRFQRKFAFIKHETSHLAPEKKTETPKQLKKKKPGRPNKSKTKNPDDKELPKQKPKLLPFVCNICSQRLHSKQHLEIHLRSHTGERPFQCEECGKGFTCKQLLNIHSIAHSSERPFQCEHCPMSYKHKRNLQQHQRTVHKDMGFITNPVGKTWRTPADKRPDFIGPKIAFPCEYCDKYFEMRCRLTQHVNKYHADKKVG